MVWWATCSINACFCRRKKRFYSLIFRWSMVTCRRNSWQTSSVCITYLLNFKVDAHDHQVVGGLFAYQMRMVREVLLAVIPTSQHACSNESNEEASLLSPVPCNESKYWCMRVLTEMFDLFLIFLHECFVLLLLLFFGLFSFRFDINNTLWKGQWKNGLVNDNVSEFYRKNVIAYKLEMSILINPYLKIARKDFNVLQSQRMRVDVDFCIESIL